MTVYNQNVGTGYRRDEAASSTKRVEDLRLVSKPIIVFGTKEVCFLSDSKSFDKEKKKRVRIGRNRNRKPHNRANKEDVSPNMQNPETFPALPSSKPIEPLGKISTQPKKRTLTPRKIVEIIFGMERNDAGFSRMNPRYVFDEPVMKNSSALYKPFGPLNYQSAAMGTNPYKRYRVLELSLVSRTTIQTNQSSSPVSEPQDYSKEGFTKQIDTTFKISKALARLSAPLRLKKKPALSSNWEKFITSDSNRENTPSTSSSFRAISHSIPFEALPKCSLPLFSLAPMWHPQALQFLKLSMRRSPTSIAKSRIWIPTQF